jgi:hypothetical protein
MAISSLRCGVDVVALMATGTSANSAKRLA